MLENKRGNMIGTRFKESSCYIQREQPQIARASDKALPLVSYRVPLSAKHKS